MMSVWIISHQMIQTQLLGWPYPVEEARKQVHIEDPNHLDRNTVEIGLKSKYTNQLIVDVGDALYGYAMNQAGLESHLDGMLVDYDGKGVKGYVESLHMKQKKK